MALCACGATASSEGNILSDISAPRPQPKRAWGSIPFRAIPTCSARAPHPIAAQAAARAPSCADQRRLQDSQVSECSPTPVLSEDVSCSSQRLASLSVLLTVKLSGARSLRCQTKALYPELRHFSEPYWVCPRDRSNDC